MASYLEHIQYVCRDLDAMVRFYTTAFGWALRGRGTEVTPDRTYDWVHIGTDDTYVAFRTPYNGAPYTPDMGSRHNHFGIVVEDLEATIRRLGQLGCPYVRKGSHPYRERLYVRDPDDNEVEIVGYRSAEPHERNNYSLDAAAPPQRAPDHQ